MPSAEPVDADSNDGDRRLHEAAALAVVADPTTAAAASWLCFDFIAEHSTQMLVLSSVLVFLSALLSHVGTHLSSRSQ
ncbi:unnamed protein product, partial [Soboliphyme baturini]|uniref:Uncharacterized protein n=1 Tax=Soboliphyme baturini TaxID=241478 RepID=A0A183JBA6_9BILA